jgi:SAM-dependent methyltransferase
MSFDACNRKNSQKLFILPPEGVLEPNGQDDPLPYYYKPLVGGIYRARIEQGLSMLRPPYGAILEVGYGSGVLLPSLCKMGEFVAGVDLQSDPESTGGVIEQLGARCTLKQGDLRNDIFDGRKFDLIVAISVLEHIHDLGPVFQRFYELLNPAGHVLVGMPRVDRFMENAFALIGFKGIEDHHVTDYRTCLVKAERWFELERRAHLPCWLPESLGLYFNMLFRKRD